MNFREYSPKRKAEHYAHLHWTAGEPTITAKNIIFNVLSTRYTRSDGRSGQFFTLQCPDWVNACALGQNSAGEDCLVMVRQYRHGSDSVTVEFPGGAMNASESSEQAALREFEEETGFTARQSAYLGASCPNAAIMKNRVHVFALWDLQSLSAQSLDANEVIDVELVPVSMLRSGSVPEFGINGIMLISWYYFLNWYTGRSAAKNNNGGRK